MISGVNHITFAVRDLERSISFYRDVLGFKLIQRHERGAYLLAGDLWICLDLDPTTRQGPLPEYTHVAFSVSAENFDGVSTRIREAGSSIWKQNRSEGASLYFLDPDGHKLEIHVGTWKDRLAHYRRKAPPGMQFFE